MRYDSTLTVTSATYPGVTFSIRRMSFGYRLSLMNQVRDLLQRLEFHSAGDAPADKLEAAILAAEMDGLFFRFGLVEISGLLIDGRAADLDTLYGNGPEPLMREIIQAIKKESSLDEEAAKN